MLDTYVIPAGPVTLWVLMTVTISFGFGYFAASAKIAGAWRWPRRPRRREVPREIPADQR